MKEGPKPGPPPRRTAVAAVIERDGRVLICQRSRHDSHPLKWEFPGGKVEPGETPRAALERELKEELAIQARIGKELEALSHRYPGRAPFRLRFFRVAEFSGEPVNRIFERIVWEEPARLPQYDFLEADTDFVRRLALGWPHGKR
ncbi:MAG: (deoxy)nucleoside triphosphate pyrophosphohydrolase [Bryobacterales bacterium]|jgi:8-oxo-dGTP diphosphatase|nr:(deoxy)nucleoside triphosphate pyrophosphohydrolase [Bryobacterales bacterium]